LLPRPSARSHFPVLGAILTAFHQCRRDLAANMFGHFLADFVANVLPALFPEGPTLCLTPYPPRG
jgi:hypothetical protein